VIDDADLFFKAASLGSSDHIVKINGPIDVRNAARLREALLDDLIANPTRFTGNLANTVGG